MGFGGTSPQSQMNVANRQIDQNQANYNRYLQMIQGMVGDSGYDFLAPKTTTTTGTTAGSGTSTTRGTSHTDQLVSPELSPEYKKMEGLWKGIMENQMTQALPPGMAEQAARDVNRSAAGAEAATRNYAASHGGLSGDAVAGRIAPIESARAGKIADLSVSLPLAERAQQREAVDLSSKLAQIFGLGHRTVGDTTMDSTTDTNSLTNMSGSSTSPGSIQELLQYLGLLQPYDRPIVQPGAQQGWGGAAIGAAGTIGAALI